jgi:hypothetical protein
MERASGLFAATLATLAVLYGAIAYALIISRVPHEPQTVWLLSPIVVLPVVAWVALGASCHLGWRLARPSAFGCAIALLVVSCAALLSVGIFLLPLSAIVASAAASTVPARRARPG